VWTLLVGVVEIAASMAETQPVATLGILAWVAVAWVAVAWMALEGTALGASVQALTGQPEFALQMSQFVM